MTQDMTSDTEIDWNDAKIAFFSRLVENKSVLDVGVVQHETRKVAMGTWLHRALRLRALDILGLDIDKQGVNFLRRLGFEVVHADAQDFHLGRTFEVITAGDLIEHLDNPGGFLECVKEHLSSEGRLVISTPNPFWWKTWIYVLLKGDASPHPEHTGWYCERTIKQLLERHGFCVEQMNYGTVYVLTTVYQKITKAINSILPLPARIRHNTIMLSARIKA